MGESEVENRVVKCDLEGEIVHSELPLILIFTVLGQMLPHLQIRMQKWTETIVDMIMKMEIQMEMEMEVEMEVEIMKIPIPITEKEKINDINVIITEIGIEIIDRKVNPIPLHLPSHRKFPQLPINHQGERKINPDEIIKRRNRRVPLVVIMIMIMTMEVEVEVEVEDMIEIEIEIETNITTPITILTPITIILTLITKNLFE